LTGIFFITKLSEMEKKKDVRFSEAQIKAFTEGRQRLLLNKLLNVEFAFSGITYWEELSCVGYNPQRALLTAVISVKQAMGYSGGLCTNGSGEYVRFFVDWHDGAGFQDIGMASFRAHDISDAPPGRQHPLKYIVTLPLRDEEKSKICFSPVLPTVRAILSWNAIPPANPLHVPFYGNVVDADIQIEPRPFYLGDLFEQLKVNPKPDLLQLIDLKSPVAYADKTAPIINAEMVKQYRELQIPDHRTLTPLLASMSGAESYVGPVIEIAKFDLDALQIDWDQLLNAFNNDEANTTYEELVCAGLQTETDTLGAVIHIKRPGGYSGNLCRRGSTEYVAFWVDWDNAGPGGYQYVGTAQVQVHDIAAIPAGGLYYSVSLPLDVTTRLRSCKNPNIVKIRAVLSWNVPPSMVNPNALNVWGNRLDRVVQIRPGKETAGLTHRFDYIGNVLVSAIDPVSHLAYGSPISDLSANRPWGGAVNFRAKLFNTGAPYSTHFQVQYFEPVIGDWLPVNNEFTFTTARPVLWGTLFNSVFINSAAYGGWFPYVANPAINEEILDNLIAVWNTGNRQGVYRVRLAYTTDPAHAPANIEYSEEYRIMLDNVHLTMNPGYGVAVNPAFAVDLVIDGGDCHSYRKGDKINGHLRAVDNYFGQWQLEAQPSSHITGAAMFSPPSREVSGAADNGDANLAWDLDTSNFDPCGYTARLRVHKRTIFDSATWHYEYVDKYVGFSIV
jgi:hypothetical protein